MDRTTVSRWINSFHGGCVSIANEPRPGRPRISRDERKVKLVADVLGQDHRATCEELSRATKAKTSQVNAQEPISVARCWATHSPWQFSPAHRGCCNQKLLDYGWEVLPHASYSLDMRLPDFDLFPKLKEPMRGRRFSSLEELSTDGIRAIRHMNKSGVLDGMIILQTLGLSHSSQDYRVCAVI